jgi:N-acetylmuramoyl-L-alanine amidase
MKQNRAIFISAGHSNNPNRDRGASGNGFVEGELTVELRELICEELDLLGLKYTLDDNDSVLRDTINFFKKLTTPNCILLDIHFNAFHLPTATGTETLVPKDYSDFERKLAESLSEAVHSILKIPKRGRQGVKTELESHHGNLGWMRLVGENVLMEICFITNPNDMKAYQEKKQELAKEIACVLFDYAY